MPLNCVSDPPLVKKVPAVPSGPTKLNGPDTLLLAAAWNWMAVLAGVEAVQESVVQCTVAPLAGLASFSEETKVPGDTKPVCMKILKPRSRPPLVVSAVQVVPLLPEVTRWPFAYGLLSGEAQLHTYA